MKRIILYALGALMSTSALAQAPYRIYPVPHRQEISESTASFSKSVNIIRGADIDEATTQRILNILSEKGLEASVVEKEMKGVSNIILGVDGSSDEAAKLIDKAGLCRKVFSLDKYDRHILHLYADKAGNANVAILGENTDAVFCALASLEQILDRGTSNLNCVDLYDYADVKHRGIIEGYYGMPYTAAVTKDIFRFMARYKLNTYMYGAKSDPYHSHYWSEPYPETITEEQERTGYLSQDMLKSITDVAHACKVDFIWAIHPGTAFTGCADNSVNDRIMEKFESMYTLGIRQFGLFVDDCGLPEDITSVKADAQRLTDLQNRIDTRWNTPGTAPEKMVKPLHYVPQVYAYSWVKPETAKAFFNYLSTVPEKVHIYITGRNIWSVPNNEDINTVSSYLGRTVSWWWNYPCNDNDMSKIFTMDIYTNFKDEAHIDNLARLETLKQVNTIINNPMQQGEISKITMFSVADFCWNSDAFNNERSYQAAIPAAVGKQYAATFAFLAPYLRHYDSDALEYVVKLYKMSVADGHPRPETLIRMLTKVVDACEALKPMKSSECESQRLFYEDMRPWLLKLEAMSKETIALLKGEEIADVDYKKDPDFRFTILNGMGDGITLSTMSATPAHTILKPFIDYLKEQK